MNIVVTNDDGIHTPGIWALAAALTQVGNVSVVAPDRERSGVGLAISLHHPVKVSDSIPRIHGVKALAVEGTPADCILLAAQGLTPEPVDLVISGINEGANVGMNVLVSGTVGAAFQAHFFGIPAIAISVATLKDPTFEASARLAAILATMFRDGTLRGPMLLNVNAPNIATDSVEGILVTRLGRGRFVDTLEKVATERHNYYWLAHGRSEWEEEDGTDIWAIRRKLISITPLHIDLTSDAASPILRGFGPQIFEDLQMPTSPPQS